MPALLARSRPAATGSRVSRAPARQLSRPSPVCGALVVKLGGELLEAPRDLARLAKTLVATSARQSLVVVHGGGREIDAALQLAGVTKQQVDGLRVTDEATLGVVIAVLAGTVNTRLVAALNRAGGAAVGLTGADAEVTTVARMPRHRSTSGARIDLGHVGQPTGSTPPRLLHALLAAGFVPAIASIAASRTGALLNVNADTLASDIAARLGASRLVIAGGTPGVLDGNGRTIATMTSDDAAQAASSGVATAGMIAKLQACRRALAAGVEEVVIVDGKSAAFGPALAGDSRAAGRWTTVRERVAVRTAGRTARG